MESPRISYKLGREDGLLNQLANLAICLVPTGAAITIGLTSREKVPRSVQLAALRQLESDIMPIGVKVPISCSVSARSALNSARTRLELMSGIQYFKLTDTPYQAGGAYRSFEIPKSPARSSA